MRLVRKAETTKSNLSVIAVCALIFAIVGLALVIILFEGCHFPKKAHADTLASSDKFKTEAGLYLCAGCEQKERYRIKAIKTPDAQIIKKDKSLSPYFFVKSEDDSTDKLPLKATRADVKISGVIAAVKVTQVYKNEGNNTLEAIYVFPASTKASVHAMKMYIGERTIEAKIEEKQKARRDYEIAKREGRTGSLLEQKRPNVFQMNVANILPGDEIKVELLYSELLVPEANVYEFVYPTVVGPRYSNQKIDGDSRTDDSWIANPYLNEGEKPSYSFDLDIEMQSGIPVAGIGSPSHDCLISYDDKNKVSLSVDDKKGGNRDFVLRYKLSGSKIETGLLLFSGEKENFFLQMVQPPKKVQTNEIVGREYVFIVDVSGSMHGFPLEVSKKLMRNLLSKLRPSDHFNILQFASGNAVYKSHSVQATNRNIHQATQFINRSQGSGGTNLLPALKKALNLPRIENSSRIVVVVTDGYVSVEKESFELIRNNLGKANLFSFGIGSSVNRFIIEGMARAGMGEPFVILNQKEADKKAERFRKYISSPVLNDIKVNFDGFEAYDVEPQSIPDLFAARPIIIFGKYKNEASGEIVITGKSSDGEFRHVTEVSDYSESDSNQALKYLWARHKVTMLADMQKVAPYSKLEKEITKLGLDYNILTNYTSFIALDSERRATGKNVTVKQPLPLPEGVSNYAVGSAGMAAAPMKGASGGGYGRGVLNRVLGYKAKRSSEKSIAPDMDMAEPMEELEDEKRVTRGNGKGVGYRGKVIRANIAHANFKVDGKKAGKIYKRQWKRYLPRIKRLYVKHLKKNPTINGKIEVVLTLSKKGKVIKVKFDSNTIKDKNFVNALNKMLMTLRFSRPKISKEFKISYKLIFKN